MADARAAAHAQFLAAVASAQAGKLEQALAQIESAYAGDPRPIYRFAQADFLASLGRADEAMALLAEVLRADPEFAPAHARRGEILLGMGRAADAVAALEIATTLRPSHVATLELLARALRAEGRHTRAEAVFALAANGDKDNARAWLSLGNARLNIGSVWGALEAFSRAEDLGPPDAAQIGSARLLAMHYDDRFDAEETFDAHVQWARRHARNVGARPAPRAGARPLRIGYVSPRLHRCSAGVLFASVLENHDRSRFEPHCYACSDIRDDLTLRIQAGAAGWCDARKLDDAALVHRMREDGIDIAVDLAGHTPGHRLGAFALRPAPVCVTWLDYFDTTGLDAMDAIITDPWHSPVEDVQRFTEAVIRLPRLRLCWEPPAGAPVVRPPPCTGGGGFVFGSFNRFAKHSPSTLDAWCRVLHAVPSSRFLLKSGSLDHPEEHAHARRRFAERGIDPNRIECRGQSPHERMLREYGDIDLALDSFPYNGGVVTCEALWMGRPVLALRGDSMISRQSAAILACVGAEEWIARDVDDFVEIAVRAAADPEGHARACLGLRERVAASPLVDAASFARDFEAALQEAWIRFAGA